MPTINNTPFAARTTGHLLALAKRLHEADRPLPSDLEAALRQRGVEPSYL